MKNNKTAQCLYVPSYYNDFKCIAQRCGHSCCIDWEICIDRETYEKYKQIKSIMSTVKMCDDELCFELKENGKCPHLNDEGLCNIIISHGEEYLSPICRNHPRFYNCISSQRMEAGLGIVCEEACRLVLESEVFSLVKAEELDKAIDDYADFDALPQREQIIAAIETEGGFDEKLRLLKKNFKIPQPYTTEQWLERFLALEILDPKWRKDLQVSKERLNLSTIQTNQSFEKYYNRLLVYFIYRHVSIAYNEDNLRARLAFAILSAEIIKALFETNSGTKLEELIDWARRYSAEIEYSEDNSEELIFVFESSLLTK